MTSPTTASSWYSLLHSTAVSYTSPPQKHGDECSKNQFYWHPDLLHQWQSLLLKSDDESTCDRNNESSSTTTTINYASLMLLAVYVADELRRKLSLHHPVEAAAVDAVTKQHDLSSSPSCEVSEKIIRDTADTLRIGMAIPEGPFLPLFVLVIHSLNIAVAEHWLTVVDDTASKWCKGVVLIPMETDEAPERLKHIVTDSSPHLILVASGDDMTSMTNALGQSPTTSTQLVNFIDLLETALSSICTQLYQHNSMGYYHSLMEKIWTSDIRDTPIENSSWDVARLVAIGCARLLAKTSSGFTSLASNYTTSSSLSSSSNRAIMSHIVYTSGTTGLPKGCISSLSSLQHYIRAKNIAHEINSQSNVMLASAVTFDPCFSDVLATFLGNATLCLAPRAMLYGHGDNVGGEEEEDEGNSYRGLTKLLRQLRITHVLCTPTLWAMVEGDPPLNIPSLRVVALGGEPIPKSMRGRWSRKRMIRDAGDLLESMVDREYPRLFATYGVTEACVYQTCGEVIEELLLKNGTVKPVHSVGLPLMGTNVTICRPLPEDDVCEESELLSMKLEKLELGDDSDPVIGEVVLSGEQVDAMSSYLNLPQLTRRVFVQSSREQGGSVDHTFVYRTGDLGYIDKRTGELYINGRIKGDGMVKINGIRIELSEIETSVIDDNVDESRGVVIDCMAALVTAPSATGDDDDDDNEHKHLIAYCILSASSISQLGINSDHLKGGVIVPRSPLLSLLRARCERRVRKGCMPSFFVILDRLPLSPTGKRSRSALPSIEKCSILRLSAVDDSSESLWQHGVAGPVVAEKICECLNIQPCQKSLITTSSSFFILGGDSLAATRLTRGLYARHHNVKDSRNLGGSSGTLDGPFAAKFLLQANTLGEYCDFLDSHSAFCSVEVKQGSVISTDNNSGASQNSTGTIFESLIESITMGHALVSMALLDFVDPNIQPIKARLGKVTDRKQQRSLFKSNPLHLACIRGDAVLVRALLDKGCKANIPDASGAFPIHLACSNLESIATANFAEEDLNRRECVKMLLEAGTPISIKDGNKQTILHSAARAGHVELLKFILKEWKIASDGPNGIKFKSHGNVGSIYDWHDRWYRTPVHWAILNKRIETLQVLLDGGCSASPPKPKQGVSKRSTSVLIETPTQMCQRLYGEKEGVGAEISRMLKSLE